MYVMHLSIQKQRTGDRARRGNRWLCSENVRLEDQRSASGLSFQTGSKKQSTLLWSTSARLANIQFGAPSLSTSKARIPSVNSPLRQHCTDRSSSAQKTSFNDRCTARCH